MRCECNVPVAEKTVVKEGPNKGRIFWKCGKGDECPFFEWADGPSNNTTNQSVSRPSAPMRKVNVILSFPFPD